ncbi:MAG TPA: hypothetical protein VJ771_07085 [Candidatus Nitrosotalea sp.]|nr:hypothetical protein [Candidatus Nitrosotalea sp.]
MEDKPTLDEMWKVIEEFGISRKSLDPHNDAPIDRVEEFYLLILERIKLGKEFQKNGHS